MSCVFMYTNKLYGKTTTTEKKKEEGEKQAWKINSTGFAYLSCNCHFGVLQLTICPYYMPEETHRERERVPHGNR